MLASVFAALLGYMGDGVEGVLGSSTSGGSPWREDGLVSIVFKLIQQALLMIEMEES